MCVLPAFDPASTTEVTSSLGNLTQGITDLVELHLLQLLEDALLGFDFRIGQQGTLDRTEMTDNLGDLAQCITNLVPLDLLQLFEQVLLGFGLSIRENSSSIVVSCGCDDDDDDDNVLCRQLVLIFSRPNFVMMVMSGDMIVNL